MRMNTQKNLNEYPKNPDENETPQKILMRMNTQKNPDNEILKILMRTQKLQKSWWERTPKKILMRMSIPKNPDENPTPPKSLDENEHP